MATISTFPFLRHLRATTTTHVEHRVAGEVRHAGSGAAFWFRPLNAAISEVPVGDREQDVLVRVRTADLQELTVPVTVTFRFSDPGLAASRVDFSVDLRTGTWLEDPLAAAGAMIHGASVAAVTTALGGTSLHAALTLDVADLAETTTARLRVDERLVAIGIEVIAVRFALLRPEPDVERALGTPARERVQQEADKATFERRALAVEREAAIGENELANQVELARRQEQLIVQKGANAHREAMDAAAADEVRVRAEADRAKVLAEATAAADRLVGRAAADSEAALLAAYDTVGREVLLAVALKELAGNLPQVDQLVLTPDLLTGLLGRLTQPER